MKLVHAHARLASLRAAALLLLALVAVSADAQSLPGPPAKPCESSEHRQFDFWVGHWDVFGPAGKKVGENRIELIADGCALLEQWTGNGGVTGKSLNIYDAVDRRWHQTWVDNSGTLLMLAGGLVERSMVMSMTGPSPDRPQGDACCSGSPGRRPATARCASCGSCRATPARAGPCSSTAATFAPGSGPSRRPAAPAATQSAGSPARPSGERIR